MSDTNDDCFVCKRSVDTIRAQRPIADQHRPVVMIGMTDDKGEAYRLCVQCWKAR